MRRLQPTGGRSWPSWSLSCITSRVAGTIDSLKGWASNTIKASSRQLSLSRWKTFATDAKDCWWLSWAQPSTIATGLSYCPARSAGQKKRSHIRPKLLGQSFGCRLPSAAAEKTSFLSEENIIKPIMAKRIRYALRYHLLLNPALPTAMDQEGLTAPNCELSFGFR